MNANECFFYDDQVGKQKTEMVLACYIVRGKKDINTDL